MKEKDLDKYEEITRSMRGWVKWHPWAQVSMWLADYEAYHNNAWSVDEAAAWIRAKLDENQALVDEVNANPLHEGLIYPPVLTGWVNYVIEDIIKFKWAMSEDGGDRYRLAFCPPFTCAYEWLASQMGGNVGIEMYKRDMRSAASEYWMNFLVHNRSMSEHHDIGYTKYWEKLVGKRLCDLKFKTEKVKPYQTSRVRYHKI